MLILVSLLSFSLFSSSIVFSGGKSSVTLKEGNKEVTLTEGATVISDSIEIKSDTIIIKGENWEYVSCTGPTTITDKERGLEIKANSLFYDRAKEIITIPSWFEINDNKEELFAEGGALMYDLDAERLELDMSIRLLKVTSSGIMKTNAEKVIYNRHDNTLSLMGRAGVDWNGDTYNAESISVNLETESIVLSGRIKGEVNV